MVGPKGESMDKKTAWIHDGKVMLYEQYPSTMK